MEHIGIKIKKKREELGMTQQELADRMGYKSRTTVNKVESGVNDITQSTILKYADALHCTPAYLLGWEDSITSDTGKDMANYLKDPRFMNYIKKVFYADSDLREKIYSMIDIIIGDKSIK